MHYLFLELQLLVLADALLQKTKKKDALLLLDCRQHAQASTVKTRRHLPHAVRGKDVDYMRNHAQSFCLDWVLIWL